MILRHVISENPPRARYYDTVTQETWFDHDVFTSAFERTMAAEMHGLVNDLSGEHATAMVDSLIAFKQWRLDDPKDIESYLMRYHAQILLGLEEGDYSWL